MRLAVPLLAFVPLLVACGGRGGPDAKGPLPAVAPERPVSEEAFAGAVRELLLTPPTARDYKARLAGVCARQMIRATARFHNHQEESGIAALTGGLYLARTRDLAPEMLGEKGKDALGAAVKNLASRGDEGRSLALYTMIIPLLVPADRREVEVHLSALTTWIQQTAEGRGPVERAGQGEAVAVARHLLEPSDVARADAIQKTTDWISAALRLREEYRIRHVPPARDEAGEAMRALQTGGPTLIAVYLRDGDAAGALAALTREGALDLVRPDLLAAVQEAARKPSADAWLGVIHALRPQTEGSPKARAEGDEADEAEEAPIDHELLRAALFQVAIEAYRADPTNLEAAGATALALEEYGMAEATPAVLAAAAKAHTDPRALGQILAVSMQAMSREVQAEDSNAARRAYRAAAPILTIADDPELEGKVAPSPAEVRAMMGEIELRDGEIAAAKQFVTEAAKRNASGQVLATLARIERYEGDLSAATAHWRQAIEHPDTSRDPATKGDLLASLSDTLRQSGDAKGAKDALVLALRSAATGRDRRDARSAEERARTERVIARIYDRFGALEPARKALERAFDAAPRDKAQAGATLSMIVARALLHGDLPSARDGLRRAMAADLDDEDVIYMALWVRYLEKIKKAPADGNADRVFSSIADDGRWVGRLSAFGSGRIPPDDLRKSAKTPSESGEALFYAALERAAAGDEPGERTLLGEMLKSGGIDLIETQLARDMLDGPRAKITGPAPDVGLP